MTISAIAPIEVPKWGLSMEEGTITQWLVEEGSAFRKGDALCEVETSKITNEMEAPFDGVLRRVVAGPGETLPVGALMAVSADAEVTDDEIEEYLSSRVARSAVEPPEGAEPERAEPGVPQPQSGVQQSPTPSAPQPAVGSSATAVPDSLKGETASDVFATPHALRLATELAVDLGKVAGTGRGGRVSKKDLHDAVRAAGGTIADPVAPSRRSAPAKSMQDDRAVPATPVARRLAASSGINLHDCRATGSRGRVCEADVREAERRFGIATAVEEAAPSGTAPEPDYEVVPFSSMRKAIGQRLQASKQTAPHFRLTTDLELDALLQLRDQVNATVPGVKLSVNDFLVKACAAALRAVPDVNVQFDEASQSVLRYRAADISVAVALPSGLITPIVRGADGKSLATISGEVHSLVTKAKANQLQPDEFQGGTFTISNLGMFGVREFDAIINPPQAAILAVGAGAQRPLGVDGKVELRTLLTATLACDHRVIDGALGARFLQELKRFVESPAQMLVQEGA